MPARHAKMVFGCRAGVSAICSIAAFPPSLHRSVSDYAIRFAAGFVRIRASRFKFARLPKPRFMPSTYVAVVVVS